MTKAEFYLLLDDVMELPKGTVKEGDRLSENWDSLAAVSFLAAADEKFGVNVPSAKLDRARTVDDLAALLGERIA